MSEQNPQDIPTELKDLQNVDYISLSCNFLDREQSPVSWGTCRTCEVLLLAQQQA